MKDWKKCIVRLDEPIVRALRALEESELQIALVCDHAQVLKGTITDGDVRRAILNNIPLEAPASSIMSNDPIFVVGRRSDSHLLDLMKKKELRQIPICDEKLRPIGLATLEDLVGIAELSNWVILMAGGIGKRLQPLTEDCPKPLLRVGDQPILETSIRHLKKQGFQKFFLAVNYKAEMIKNYFQDGSAWDVQISYLEEKERLGTAGALSLLPEVPADPFVVMNGDLLTTAPLHQMLDFHDWTQSKITVGVRDYEVQLPYGVVELEHERIIDISEKPVKRFLVNAGIYCVSPEVLQFVKPGEFLDMTSLVTAMQNQKQKISAYPIKEYWMDIGRIEDFNKAHEEFPGVFQ